MSTTKKLFLMRHAEPEEGLGKIDFDRQLTPNGRAQALQLGQRWQKDGFCPDAIISSAAQRTTQTAQIIADALGFGLPQISLEQDLYATHEYTLLQRLHQIPESCHSVLIVNHNPAISALLEYLVGRYLGMLTPGSLAALHFDLPWNKLAGGTTTLDYLHTPTTG
ncbi:MAG: histidine phosphatase family protein [Bernardetiaceae bacterium]